MKHIFISLVVTLATFSSWAEGSLKADDDPNLSMGRTNNEVRDQSTATVIAPDTAIQGTSDDCCSSKASSTGIHSNTNPSTSLDASASDKKRERTH